MNRLLTCSLEQYHRDEIGVNVPTLNPSTAKIIISRNALTAWMYHPKGGGLEKAAKRQMNFGGIIHAVLLSRGAKAQIVDAKDWRTNKAKDERDKAIAAGNIPLLPKDYDEVIRAAATVKQQLDDRGVSLEGSTEQPMAWQEEGVWCRGCMDLYQFRVKGFIETHGIDAYETHNITELKFTEWPLTDSSLRRLIRQMSYDLQAAAYVAGVHIITGEKPAFKWIFAEMNAPYQIRIVRPSDLMLQVGQRKWEKARNVWKACLESGVWTGYDTAEVELDPDFFELRDMDISVYPPTEVIGEEYAEQSTEDMWF